MNSLINKVQLVGHLGTDVEIKKFDSGTIKANFRMATTENYKDAQGNKKEETQWHNIVAWGKQAEILEKYNQKGSELMLEGKIVYRNYETKEGEKRYITEIEVRDFKLMSGGNKNQTATPVLEVVENDGMPF
jgi:single-strand DNA-binding protein